MNMKNKRIFINNFIKSVKKEVILKKLNKTPIEWNGIELREWIADKFKENSSFFLLIDKKRKREYNNTVLINNL